MEDPTGARRLRVPPTLVLLFGMMVAAWLATYVLPQGTFETIVDEDGHRQVVAGTYRVADARTLLPPWALFTAVPRAMAEAQSIIFFVLIIGGALAVVRATGALDALLGRLLIGLGGHPTLLVPCGLFVFAVGSSTIGMAEEYIPFVALLVALCRGLRMDAVTAVAILAGGYGIGYGVAAINPFTVLIAQEVAGLAPTSGAGFRLALFVPFVAIGAHHVWRYAQRVQRDPHASLMAGLDRTDETPRDDHPAMTARRTLVLWLGLAALVLVVWGVGVWGWYLTELSAVFLALALVAVLVGGLGAERGASAFAAGATELTFTALLIGFARAISLLLEDGQVLHTIVHGLSMPLALLGAELAAIGMLVIQTILNLFIPSGSGQAYATMPIMAPIGDIVGISRQTAVLAFQFGDGFTNMVVPTNPVLMGILGIAGIPYTRWFRFVMPLILKLVTAAAVTLVIAVLIGYR